MAIHAGGVASGDRGVLLTGPTEAGKSTLTAGLVLAGMSYLGDEAIGIDASTGRLLPYAKPLSLDVGSQPLFAQLAPVAFGGTQTGDAWHVPVDAIRSGAIADGASLAHVVLCRYVPGAATTLTELSRAEALVELASLTFRFPSRSRRSLDVLATALSGSTCHRLVSGDLDEAVASVSALVGSESAHARDVV